MNQEQTKNTIILTIIAISVLVIFQAGRRENNLQPVEVASAEQNKPERIDYFKDIAIEAKAGIAFDVSANSAIFDKNSTEQLPLASITKIMTAIVAEDIYSPENKYLPPEKLNGLMTAMLIESNNDAASIIAKSSETSGALNFIALMNKKAGELGLSQTIFSNPTGLDISSTVAGAYGSAKDVANLLLFGYQKYPEVFSQTKFPEVEVNGEKMQNKNLLTVSTPNIIAGKTGLTNLAGGNLAILIQENNKLFAIVVLGSTEQGRFDDVAKLISAVTQYSQQ